MKKVILFLLLICPFIMSAQELVSFKVTPDGNFVSSTGEDFVVVPFEGKNAHQIYQMLASNVGSVYNDPSKVMSGVEDASIKIRAFSDNIYTKKVMGIPHAFQGFYQIEFRIKNGKLKEKEAPNASNIELQLNGAINGILGLSGSTSKVDDNW